MLPNSRVIIVFGPTGSWVRLRKKSNLIRRNHINSKKSHLIRHYHIFVVVFVVNNHLCPTSILLSQIKRSAVCRLVRSGMRPGAQMGMRCRVTQGFRARLSLLSRSSSSLNSESQAQMLSVSSTCSDTYPVDIRCVSSPAMIGV